MGDLATTIAGCRICADRFAATATAPQPAPRAVVSCRCAPVDRGASAGRAGPRQRTPFDDASGERLRDWLGLERPQFYDRTRVAIVPMAFCFPGYNARGADLPPPAICAQTWRGQVMAALGDMPLTVLVGGHAMRWHLGAGRVDDRVRAWRDHAPRVFPLPHPSWRNTAWLRRNPWFEAKVLPALRARVQEVLA